jgi:hypothetical protein
MWKGEAGVDIGRSINYVFQDPEWIKKVLIGGLLLLIPIIGWAIVAGYYMRTARQIALGADVPLPEWNDWVGDLVRGIKLWVVAIIWAVPIWAIVCIAVALAAIAGEDFGGILALPFQCLAFIFGIAILFLAPLIYGRLAMTEQIADGLNVSAIIAEAQRYPKELLIVLVIYWVVSFVAQFGIILCVIGILFTSFIAFLIYAHLIGQIRRLAGAGAAAAPPPPPPAGSPTY